MEQEKFNKAVVVNRAINFHEMITDRLNGKFSLNFGLSIQETPVNFFPITDLADKELLEQLTDITRKYCEKKINSLKAEFEGI